METSARDNYLKIIEAQEKINGRFTKIRRVDPRGGCGMFSLVFRAFDETTKREVALKFYDPCKRGYTDRVRYFEREAVILGRLIGQRDILQLVLPLSQFSRQIVDVGTGITVPDNLVFFATELADSNMLDYIYQEEPSPARTLAYFRAMVRGVQRVHSQSICHRDIKPENFLRIGKSAVCLADFGTARILDGTMAALFDDYSYWRGDKRYTAPEQCVSIGDKPHLFYVGDMYSLGAILFEMFTRQLLFPVVFDHSFHQSLSDHFALIPQERREGMLSQVLPDVARTRRLPSISDFSTEVPSCIRDRVERLYKGLASIDYRQRTRDFGTVFQELSVCETILAKEKEYSRMLKLRQVWAENRKKNKERNALFGTGAE